jgi:hypothetical protein
MTWTEIGFCNHCINPSDTFEYSNHCAIGNRNKAERELGPHPKTLERVAGGRWGNANGEGAL